MPRGNSNTPHWIERAGGMEGGLWLKRKFGDATTERRRDRKCLIQFGLRDGLAWVGDFVAVELNYLGELTG